MIYNMIAKGSGGSAAISITDTPDSGGGTVRTITASGATIPTPSSDISKLILNGVTQMDVTDTTATVSDVASGKVFTQVDGTTGTGTASGMPYLEYWGDISVLRQGGFAQPTFPVVAGRCIVAFCPDEKEGSTKEYVMLFATYNADGTRYTYGALSEEDGRSIQTNYGVTEGAEYMTPTRYVAFPGWMADHTLTAPAYIIVNSKKDED